MKRNILTYIKAQLFHDCIMGIKDVVTTLLEHNMSGFLESFEEHVEVFNFSMLIVLG